MPQLRLEEQEARHAHEIRLAEIQVTCAVSNGSQNGDSIPSHLPKLKLPPFKDTDRIEINVKHFWEAIQGDDEVRRGYQTCTVYDNV